MRTREILIAAVLLGLALIGLMTWRQSQTESPTTVPAQEETVAPEADGPVARITEEELADGFVPLIGEWEDGGFQKHGWKYKGAGIRLLSFSLAGDAELPIVADDRFSFNPPDTGDEPLDDALVALGFGIYHQSSCAVCHGGNATSNGAAGPDLRESPLMTDYRAFRAVVAEGALLQNSMPMFDDLTEREVRGVYEYIRQQIRLAD